MIFKNIHLVLVYEYDEILNQYYIENNVGILYVLRCGSWSKRSI